MCVCVRYVWVCHVAVVWCGVVCCVCVCPLCVCVRVCHVCGCVYMCVVVCACVWLYRDETQTYSSRKRIRESKLPQASPVPLMSNLNERNKKIRRRKSGWSFSMSSELRWDQCGTPTGQGRGVLCRGQKKLTQCSFQTLHEIRLSCFFTGSRGVTPEHTTVYWLITQSDVEVGNATPVVCSNWPHSQKRYTGSVPGHAVAVILPILHAAH